MGIKFNTGKDLFTELSDRVPASNINTHALLGMIAQLLDDKAGGISNLFPGGVGMYVGKTAKGFDKMRQFSNLGDKQVRAEISDAGAKPTKLFNDLSELPTKIKGQTYRLNRLYEHPELYEAYPWLRDIPVAIRKTGDSGATGNHIRLSSNIDFPYGTRAEVNWEDLNHEIQHVIGDREKFARGGNVRRDGDNYFKQAGEIEARDTARRLKLTDAERMSDMPYASQGIPLKDWIYDYVGGIAKSVDSRGEIANKIIERFYGKTKAGKNIMESSLRSDDQGDLTKFIFDDMRLKFKRALEQYPDNPSEYFKRDVLNTNKRFNNMRDAELAAKLRLSRPWNDYNVSDKAMNDIQNWINTILDREIKKGTK